MKRVSVGIAVSLVAALLLSSEHEAAKVFASENTGELVYKESCMSCHGADGNSGFAPDIVSDSFKRDYSDLNQLKQFLSTSMPDNAPGSLSEAEYQAVSEYLWKLNGRTIKASSSTAVTVLLNGKQLLFPVPPVIKNETTLVPLREIFEALGASVKWDAATRTVLATKTTSTIKLVIGSKTVTKGTQTITLSQPAQIIEGKTFVPLRFVSEALGAQVKYDEATKVITITKK
ncbi:stalk domain-containing protein [Brevibacillus sp. SYSU BS000544]|uniref:stalk domain-containing protein n=1 Tax=Brevibacillus sp. SYSU BS000544 TaxID=3416443 RepID=UPI003CE537C2